MGCGVSDNLVLVGLAVSICTDCGSYLCLQRVLFFMGIRNSYGQSELYKCLKGHMFSET